MKVKSIHITTLIIVVFAILLFIDFYGINHDVLREDNLFAALETNLQDRIFQDEKNPDTKIKMIVIDDASLEAIGAFPWDRSIHAELINILSQGKPAAIGFDVIFSEERDPEQDQALVEAVRNAGNVIIPTFGQYDQIGGQVKSSKDFATGELMSDLILKPFPALAEVSKTGHINAFQDVTDGVMRQHLTRIKYQDESGVHEIPSFSIALYNQYLEFIGQPPMDINKIPTDKIYRTYIDFTSHPSDYEPIPYYQVLDGTIDPEYFKDSIVLIGPYAVGLADYFYTSIDKQTNMYGVEIHANILQTLLEQRFKQPVPFVVNLFILLFLSLFSYFIFKRFIPAVSFFLVGAALVLYILVVNYVYNFGFMLSVLYPIASAAIVYIIMIAYRYIEELLERKRITGIFGRYVAPQIVKEILDKGETAMQLGGTRREISALFVDIRGFTPMSEKAQPEEVVSILNEYLDLCAQSIFKFGGTLDKFIGDATMAIFNAPLDLADHAFMAVQTAWAMKEGSIPLQAKLQEKYGRSVQFGIGVNTGFAVVGNIGSKSRMDYTAIGDTVNTAARLESNSKPGQILISEATYEKVKDRVLVTALGGIKVKGKEQEITIYQLDGIK